MSIGPRHTNIRHDSVTAALQNAENARDLRDALARRVEQWPFTVEPYTATGSTSDRINIGADRRPLGVQLLHGALYYDRAAPLGVTGNVNFLWDATSKSIGVFEPTGLVVNEVYTLTFLVTEA